MDAVEILDLTDAELLDLADADRDHVAEGLLDLADADRDHVAGCASRFAGQFTSVIEERSSVISSPGRNDKGRVIQTRYDW